MAATARAVTFCRHLAGGLTYGWRKQLQKIAEIKVPQ